MAHQFLLRAFFRQNNQQQWLFRSTSLQPISHNFLLHFTNMDIVEKPSSYKPHSDIALTRKPKPCCLGYLGTTLLLHSVSESNSSEQEQCDQSAIFVNNILKYRRDKSNEEIERALDRCGLVFNDTLVLNVLQRLRDDWRQAYVFFNWVSRRAAREDGFIPGVVIYNQILDILGRMKCFVELRQVLDKICNITGLANEDTYEVLLRRYAAGHKVKDCIGIFHQRELFGVENDMVAFQKVLTWLCRYKHVEDAETLLYSCPGGIEFRSDIKTWNIVLNGWCVLGNVYEAKRFWKDIMASKCKPDLYTYSTFIKALTKKGRLGSALKLFRAMWDRSCMPDVVICNCMIDALCFKKRIPEALLLFQKMHGRDCSPNAVTYNTLIKHLCKIQRFEKVHELLSQMEKNANCLPNARTYIYILKSLKKPEQVSAVLELMDKNGHEINDDTYNLILRLYLHWDCQERVRETWQKMEKKGIGHDRRSYTIMIHGNHQHERFKDALRYFNEMKSKGIAPEPRTEILVESMNVKLKRESIQTTK